MFIVVVVLWLHYVLWLKDKALDMVLLKRALWTAATVYGGQVKQQRESKERYNKNGFGVSFIVHLFAGSLNWNCS